MKPHLILLTLCLPIAASAAFAGDGAATPPVPAAPSAPAVRATSSVPPTPSVPATPSDHALTVPSPPDSGDAASQGGLDAEHRRLDMERRRLDTVRRRMDMERRRMDEASRKRDAALQAQMDAARSRMEVAAQQLAALSAQMYAPMMRHLQALSGPPHALIGVQLERSSGAAGARVREVSPGGPAERAGVRTGDLIVAVNGTDVRGNESARRVVELLQGVKPGDKVDLRLVRHGNTRDVAVTARPDWGGPLLARPLPEMPLPRIKALAGPGGLPLIIRGPVADMELARVTPGLGRYFGTDDGVLVVHAPSDGALGLQDGDVILSIDGRRPIDSSHVIRILASYDPGEKISMEVMRGHRRMPITATLPAQPAMPRPVMMMRKGSVPGPGPLGGSRPLVGPGRVD